MSTTENVSFLPALKLIGVIAVFIGALVGIMFFLNKQRNEVIVKTYTEETLKYESENTSGLNTLFSDTFNQSSGCTTQIYSVQQGCYATVRDVIYKNIATNLKDFSSTFFIRLRGNTVEVLTLDGAFSQNSFTNNNNSKQKEQVVSLLSAKVNQIPWADYFYTISGKEVVIPVDYQGKRIGAIVRRVVEN